MAVEQGRGGAFDFLRHGKVAKGHLAHVGVHVGDEGFAHGPRQRGTLPALSAQPIEDD